MARKRPTQKDEPVPEGGDVALSAYGFNRCRTFGHAWNDVDVTVNGFVRITLSCLRCGTHRIDEVSRGTASLYSRRYEYTDGYQRHDNHRRDEFRAAYLAEAGGKPRRLRVAE